MWVMTEEKYPRHFFLEMKTTCKVGRQLESLFPSSFLPFDKNNTYDLFNLAFQRAFACCCWAGQGAAGDDGGWVMEQVDGAEVSW